MKELTDLEIITIISYMKSKTGGQTSRREIATIFNVYLLARQGTINPDIEVYPDGVDDPSVNKSIDYLVYVGVLKNINGKLILTPTGKNIAEELVKNSCDVSCLNIFETILDYPIEELAKLVGYVSEPQYYEDVPQEILELAKDINKIMSSERKTSKKIEA